jgi:hypothetical protein
MAIEYERTRRHAPGLFRGVEREIISRELADLEGEWAENDPAGSLARLRSQAPDWKARVNRRRNRRA